MRRAIALVLLCCAGAPVAAQIPQVEIVQDETSAPGVSHRRALLGTIVGALVIGLPVWLTINDSPYQQRCGTRECLTAVGAASGAALGFMIGREMDQARARRQGSTTAWRRSQVDLPVSPVRLMTFDGGGVVTSRTGFAYVADGSPAERRAPTLRDVIAVGVLPANQAVLAATTTGIFALPQGDTAAGRLITNTGASSVLVLSDASVYLGGTELRRVSATGTGSDLQLTEEAVQPVGAVIVALEHSPFSGVLWSLTRDRLSAHAPGTLQVLGSVEIPAEARNLSISGGRALVSAGSGGLYLLDVSRPEAPHVIQQITGVPFVFDAVLRGNVAYLAAGRGGLLQLDLSDPQAPRITRALRNIGLVIDVAVGGEDTLYAASQDHRRLYLLDLE